MTAAAGRRAARAARLGVVAILLAAGARADRLDDQIPPKPTRYVTDRAGVLGGEADALNGKLDQFERETSSQILVWIDRRIPEGFTLEDFTVRAAQKWGAGRAKEDNGLVLFVFTEDRKLRIEVGYGLEGAVPDVTAKRIIEDEITPRFRSGDIPGGVTAGVDALMDAARGEYKGTGRTLADRRRPNAAVSSCLPWAFFFGVFFLLPWILRRNRHYRTFRGDGWSSGVGGFPIIFPGRRSGGGGWSTGGWSSGGGGWSGGGGFSGGGGSFGGGGASGSW